MKKAVRRKAEIYGTHIQGVLEYNVTTILRQFEDTIVIEDGVGLRGQGNCVSNI